MRDFERTKQSWLELKYAWKYGGPDQRIDLVANLIGWLCIGFSLAITMGWWGLLFLFGVCSIIGSKK